MVQVQVAQRLYGQAALQEPGLHNLASVQTGGLFKIPLQSCCLIGAEVIELTSDLLAILAC